MKYAYVKYHLDQDTIKGYTLFDDDDVFEVVKDIEDYYHDQPIWEEIVKEFHQHDLIYNSQALRVLFNNRLKEINKQLTIFHCLIYWKDAYRLLGERKRINRYQNFLDNFIEDMQFDSIVFTKTGKFKIGKTEKVIPVKKLF